MIYTVRDEKAKQGYHASFLYHHENSHLMRIANNSVSLNSSETLTRLVIRVIDNRKVGTCVINTALQNIETIRNAFDTACKRAEESYPKQYDPLLEHVQTDCSEQIQYDSAVASVDPEKKMDVYRDIIDNFGENMVISGAWSSGSTELFLVSTTNKNTAFHSGTDQHMSVMLRHPVQRWELAHEQTGWKLSDIESTKSVTELKKLQSLFTRADGVQVAPGNYTVVLGSNALAQLLHFALRAGLYAKDREELRGWCAKNNPGDTILGNNVSIYDDPDNDNTFRFGFDYAGKKRSLFPLVHNGILQNFMYDRETCAKYHKPQTGHSLDSLSIVMESGSAKEDPLMVTGGDREALYIPKLHYMNVADRQKGIVTASSRFNALHIGKNGEIHPVFAARITDTFKNIFSNIAALSCSRESVNLSTTYGARAPIAFYVPSYTVVENVIISDCADSF